MSDSELSASTAQLGRLEEAVGSYWDCAYQEGHLNRPDGDKANAILHEIRCAARELVATEREACAKVCEAMKTRPPSEVDDVERGYNASLRRAAEAIRLRSNA